MAVPEQGTYVEHVSSDVEATRTILEATHGWRFGEPDPDLGGSRIAKLPDGSLCGIRGPLRPDETPVTRRYVCVTSATQAAKKAEEAGAFVALAPMKLGRHGTIAIFIVGGVDHGVWELPRSEPQT